jgi:hypothetical protein
MRVYEISDWGRSTGLKDMLDDKEGSRKVCTDREAYLDMRCIGASGRICDILKNR